MTNNTPDIEVHPVGTEDFIKAANNYIHLLQQNNIGKTALEIARRTYEREKRRMSCPNP